MDKPLPRSVGREKQADTPSDTTDLSNVSDDGSLTTPDGQSDRTLALIEQFKSHPTERIKEITEAVIRVTRATNAPLILAQADADRRRIGMWIGACMSLANVVGGVAILISAAPAVIGVGLLCLGAACAGATFAIITGKSITMADFSAAMTAMRSTVSDKSSGVEDVK